MSEVKLKELMLKRSSIKGRLTKFKIFLNQLKLLKSLDDIEKSKVSIQLGKIEALCRVFEELQSQIEVLNPEEMDLELEERDSIELEFATLIATAQQFQNTHNQASNCNVDVNGSSHCCHEQTGIGFRPPTLQIGKFDGSYNKWLEFRDLYCSLVHDNKHIPAPIKFCYLNSYLEGEASRVISNLEVTEANYNKAWDLLCERYDNKRLLIKGHLNSLLNFDIKSSESDKVLRSIVDNINKNLRALSSLGEPTTYWDTLIIHIVSSKLASQTSMKWEEYRNSLPDSPSLEQFNKFLKDRADILETYNHPRSSGNTISELNNNYNKKKRAQANVFAARISELTDTVKGHTPTCEVCKGTHRIYDCENFKNKSIVERQALVSSLRLCRNCLRKGHDVYYCRARSCRKCKKRHNSLICSNGKQLAPQDNTAPETVNVSSPAAELTVNLARNNVDKVTLLSTALVEAVNPVNKKSEIVRVLLDCGAESSLISKGLQDRLELQSSPVEPVNLIGIGNATSHCTNEVCSFHLKSLHSDYVVKLTCPVLPDLTGDIPRLSINTNNLNIPPDVQLADSNFHKSSPIDVLVGADLFWHIVGCERQSLGSNKPYLISSEFGWILSGPIYTGTRPSKLNCNFQVASSQADNLDKLLTRFWELEEASPKKLLSPDEKACEEHFQANTTRDSAGRFCVRLPLKDSPVCLGNSYIAARKRFLNLEKRFRAQPELKAQYVKFINEYIMLGHCTILSGPRVEPSYFLCHHAVLKEQSESTKLRVVFDASCSTSSGVSINDLQYIGPTIQDTLFSILLRFRQYRYVLTGDIEKMFRQIQVHENDRNLQLILWRDDEHRPLQILRLNTVTYGFASASYLSTKCLWRLSEECEDDLIKMIIQHDFYMDDLLTGADSISDLRYIFDSVVSILRSGCFPLRKFKSNIPLIFESALIDPQENLTLSESTSILGLQWKPSTDTLNIVVSIPDNTDDYITKRLILSHSFKIFDPLGLISPCTIRPKVLMQELWRRSVGWDEPLPCDLQQTWDELKRDLSKLEFVQVPRLALCTSSVPLELHSFCDASAIAHGCCLYMRSANDNGDVVVRLLCAKSRVNPSKPTTIPRLELLGALLAARLCKSVLESLRCKVSRCVHWSDSSVVLGWLQTSPGKLKTFVANRVVEICETTTSTNWRHVPTACNPADLISRGTRASSLLDSHLWWSGPEFLTKPETFWPVMGEQVVSELPEIKVHSVQITENVILFERFSNLMRLKRAFAFVLRFVHNVKNPQNKRAGPLTVEELEQSFMQLCKFAQLQSFPKEHHALANSRDISAQSNLKSLSPFLDKDGVMRVGGRLEHSEYGYDKKHPVLLHSKHHLSELIFRYEHIRHMHAGPQLLLYTVRNYVWPLGGRQLARRTARNCVKCRRFIGKTVTPLMGQLPVQRTMPAFPFQTTGVDFAGPFTILNRKGRGSKTSKCYLCLFICFRYKCVHLEAVTELSKESFILTLRRFIGRRGKPVEIYCDNGRNFVATAKELASFLKDGPKLLSDFSATEQIKFQFIPAYTPHFGGLWEAGIKSAKHHIKRVVGSSNLTYEELSTLFAQVEAILNSRPLYPMSSSPDDLQSLTPGHFLIGRALTSQPDPTLEAEKTSNLQRYARVEQARQHFWRRWQNEYISELQQRSKWRTNKNNTLRVGDLVLLQEENCPPLHWRLGRVKLLVPGIDGVARIAEVSTQKGDVRRAVTRLCPLLCKEVEEEVFRNTQE